MEMEDMESMNRTSIEWCRTYNEDGTFTKGYTVNPIRFRPYGATRTTTMCQKLSPGCVNCYASTIVNRFWPLDANEKFPGFTAQGVASGEFVLDEKQLESVLKHKKPCKIFWCDMTDAFGEWVPAWMLDACFAVCALTPHITHMFLTKRPERMLQYFKDESLDVGANRALAAGVYERILCAADKMTSLNDPRRHKEVPWPLPSVWLGTSCENQKYADERIPILCQVPAAVRFISAEPLIGAIDLEYPETLYPDGPPMCCNETDCWCQGQLTEPPLCYGLKMVIVGGESGPKARPMDPTWMRSLRDQCKRWNISFFAKQMGSVYGEHKGKNLPDDLNIRQFPGEIR